jgi:hypothetical protein
MTGVQSLAEAHDFSYSHYIQISSEAHLVSNAARTSSSFLRCKEQLGCDAYHLPPTNTKIKSE